jgi:ADP-heptose:LPS heptosyltransferase
VPARERILVIRHRAAGDLLLTTPALRALRAAFPSASIEVLVARRMEGLLEGNDDVDRVTTVDRGSTLSQAGLYARLARGGYAMVLDLVSNPRSAFMTALTRARVRAGYDIPGRAWAYTLRVPREPVDAAGRPAVRYAPEAALDVVRALGIAPAGLGLRFRVSERARALIDRWLQSVAADCGGKPLVACLPTGSWSAKTWLPDRFAATMDALSEEAMPLWIWGPGELAAVESVRSRMERGSLLAPPTGWQELGALLERCALLVCNDSGPKHVAVALGTPTVTIFGPTHPVTWHPPDGPHAAVEAVGLECLHCNANDCPLTGDRWLRCMLDVTVERVTAEARALLRRPARESACANL